MMPARKRTAAPKRKAESKEKDTGGKKKKPSEYLFVDLLTGACQKFNLPRFYSVHDPQCEAVCSNYITYLCSNKDKYLLVECSFGVFINYIEGILKHC